MKATEQFFTVVLFIMLYNVLLTFESVDEILEYDHSNESYQQHFQEFRYIREILKCDHSNENNRTTLSLILY